MRIVLGSLAFFLSGFAALIYQVVWQRMLVLPIGADVYSTTVIVGAFMAGLGAGSLAGGHVADRLTRTRCLRMFIAAETAVGLFGAASRSIFYDWMYLTLGGLALPPAASAIVIFAALIWPTFWMGMSLPLPARAVTARIRARLASPAVQDYYFRAGVNINALLARYLDTPPGVLTGPRTAAPAGLNEDLFPGDEFGVRYPAIR
jgi:predicted membrane-bound spermidine synthase